MTGAFLLSLAITVKIKCTGKIKCLFGAEENNVPCYHKLNELDSQKLRVMLINNKKYSAYYRKDYME